MAISNNYSPITWEKARKWTQAHQARMAEGAPHCFSFPIGQILDLLSSTDIPLVKDGQSYQFRLDYLKQGDKRKNPITHLKFYHGYDEETNQPEVFIVAATEVKDEEGNTQYFQDNEEIAPLNTAHFCPPFCGGSAL